MKRSKKRLPYETPEQWRKRWGNRAAIRRRINCPYGQEAKGDIRDPQT